MTKKKHKKTGGNFLVWFFRYCPIFVDDRVATHKISHILQVTKNNFVLFLNSLSINFDFKRIFHQLFLFKVIQKICIGK